LEINVSHVDYWLL